MDHGVWGSAEEISKGVSLIFSYTHLIERLGLMTQSQKALERIKVLPTPSDVRWEELVSVLRSLGYTLLPAKKGGSYRRFHNKETDHVIQLHEPHPANVVKKCYIKAVVEVLKEQGLID
jgi:hypothetical protein